MNSRITVFDQATAERTRAIQRTRRKVRRLARGARALDALTIPKALADGTLPIEALDTDLEVQLTQAWDHLDVGDDVVVVLSSEDVVTFKVTDAAMTFPHSLYIPKVKLVEGVHELHYRVTIGSGVTSESTDQPLIVDKTPPNHGAKGGPVNVPPEVEDDKGVSADYLAANDDKLVAIVPAYALRAVGDVIEFTWTAYPSGHVYSGIKTVTAPADLSFEIPGDEIRQGGEGTASLRYNLKDKAGNENNESDERIIGVFLTPLPGTLTAPRVLLAEDGLIDVGDTLLGVDLEVAFYDNALAGDRIIVHWGAKDLPSETISDPSTAGFPFVIRVRRSDIEEVGSGTFDVSYTLHRGASYTKDSPPLSVEVDISVIGPVDPDPDTPENEDLLAATIQGKGSLTDNVIQIGDLEKGGTASVPFYTGAAVDDIVTVYWGDDQTEAAPAKTLVQADIDAAAPFEFDIDAAVIDPTPNNPAHKVFYRLTKASNPNANLSMTTLVDVRLVGPGGPGGLKEAEFLDTNDRGWLVEGLGTNPFTRVQIPAYENAKVGDTIDFRWVGTEGLDGQGAEMPDTEFKQDDIAVTDDIIANGLIVQVPYANILPIGGYNSANVTYIVTQDGADYVGAEAFVKVDMEGPGR